MKVSLWLVDAMGAGPFRRPKSSFASRNFFPYFWDGEQCYWTCRMNFYKSTPGYYSTIQSGIS